MLFPTTGQPKYTVAMLRNLRTLKLMPEHVEALYKRNFAAPSKSGETISFDAAIEEANALTQSRTHRATKDNIVQQLDELPVVQAALEGLQRAIGGSDRRDADGDQYERVRRSFGTDVDARIAMGALWQRCLFDRFHEEMARSTPRNLFRKDEPELNPKLLQRRAVGRERLEQVTQEVVLNGSIGGRHDVPPGRKHFGALRVLKLQPRQLSQHTLQRRLRKAMSALSGLLDGTYTAGPHWGAEWHPELQRFLPRHGNKAGMRDWVNRSFGGSRARLVELEGRTCVLTSDGREHRVTDLLIDFLMLGRRLPVRQAKLVNTPKELIIAVLTSLRPAIRAMGPAAHIHLHADQSILGTIEKGVTVSSRVKTHGGGLPPRMTLRIDRPMPPAVQRGPQMFAKLLDNRPVRKQLFDLVPGAFDNAAAVSAVLPHPETQQLRLLGFHPQPGTEWRVGEGAAALGHTTRNADDRVIGIEPLRVEHQEADTSLFYAAMQVARGGGVALVRMEDTDAVWIGPLAWALTCWWHHPGEEIRGEVFIQISPQYKTSEGDKWDTAKHSGEKGWFKEELVSLRERVEGIARHPALQHLAPLQAVLTMVYACILFGGDTTAYFKGKPHARCFTILLEYLAAIGPIVSDVTTSRVRSQQVPTAQGILTGVERLVMALFVAGAATTNGRGANWPKFSERSTHAEEVEFIRTITHEEIWATLLPE